MIEFLNLVVLTFTLIFIIKYTKTAQKQTSEIIKQRQLSTLPSLSFQKSDRENSFCYLKINNFGNGTAINVTIDDIQVSSDKIIKFNHHQKIQPNDRQSSKFQATFYIKDAQSLRMESFQKTDDIEFSSYFDINNDKKIFHIKFRFQDIQGNDYEQSNQFVRGKYRISTVIPDQYLKDMDEIRRENEGTQPDNITRRISVLINRITRYISNVIS